VKLPSLETVEILARTGFDFIVIDCEHSPLSLESTYRAIVVGQALGLSVMVRVPNHSGSYVQRVLDAGADGILVPQVADLEMARAVTAQMMFPPEGGVRGAGSTSRAGLWGLRSFPDYLAHGRDALVRAVQLEDRDALENAEALLSAPGLNACFIGLADVALSSGQAADHPEIEALVDGFIDAARRHDLPCGTAVGNAAGARDAARRGFSFIMVSNDASIFALAARDLIASVKHELAADA
jgi:2-keto-3-deoxy-L-rhamnonate aldolase RhmA